MSTDFEPVHVHVTNAHELKPEAPKPRDIALNVKTFILKTSQTSDPVDSVVQRILDRDPGRVQAIVSVASGTVFLCHTRAQAQAAASDSSAIGGAQDGFLLPATVVAPLILFTTDPVWAVVPSDKAATGAQVSVISEIRRS